MLVLVIGLVVFLGVHLLPTAPELRNGLVARLGERNFKMAFALVSLVGFALIVVGFGKVQEMPSKNPVLWNPPLWTRHVAFTLMPIAFVLLAAAYIPSHIKHWVKHPMLTAVKIWAFVHLLANGELASIILFASFLAFAVYDRISLKTRRAPIAPAPSGYAGDALAAVIGLGAFVAMLLWGHARLVGVPLLPGWT
jgi:uncharacterized membrane protein